jgi:HSP20 family protein
MAVVRWSPWSDLFDLHTQLDHAFQAPATASRNGVEYTSLPVDIQQTEAAFIVEASVPGFKHSDVEVTFEDGVLTIAGKRTTSETAKDATYLRRERRTTSVFRQVGLPAEVRADDITASFENGVLRVTVPRAQKAQPKRIPVTVSDGVEKTEHIVDHAPVATA